MKKLILVTLIIFPSLLMAQTGVLYAGSDTIKRTEIKKDHGSSIRFGKNYIGIATDFPSKSPKHITDYTNTLSFENKLKLEKKLEDLEKTSAQVAVVILESVGHHDLMVYGRVLASRWNIGYDNENKGILILVAVDDQKVVILARSVLQSKVTESVSRDIIEKSFIPHFANGDYYSGLDAGIDVLINILR